MNISKAAAAHSQAMSTAIDALKNDTTLSAGLKTDMLKHFRGVISFTIDSLENPRSAVVTDEEFRELVG